MLPSVSQAWSDGPSTVEARGDAVVPSPFPRTGLQMAYFRTWHDRVADPTKPNCFGDIPAEVDVAFVFPDFTPPENPFWRTLRDEYVPKLHERGTALEIGRASCRASGR